MSEHIPGLLWLVVLLVGNAFFVAGEFAVMGARRSQIEPRLEDGSKLAKYAMFAMEHVTHILAICQLGITACSLLILNVSEPAIAYLLGVPLKAMGIDPDFAATVAFVIALVVVTFLHVTLGEMVPKNAAVSVADRAVMLLAPPLVLLDKILRPIILVLNWCANVFLRLFRVEPQQEVTSTYTLEEVQSIVQESQRTGLVDDQSGILSGALSFSDVPAERVMVPIDQIVSISSTGTPEEFDQAVRKTGLSRLVVDDASDNTVIGYLHIKDLMSIPDDRYTAPIPVNRVRSMVNITMDKPIEDALAVMQRIGVHMARVQDHAGETVGVLFLEDVIEVLVGEIRDVTQSQTVTVRQRMGGAGGTASI
ncbi:hemolysin family protein [Yaniella halotolerans]|uniref:hemolysin family protein n=1 Tax=Yaniella halotolerans TaxID=225453 RepID=UPI0003B4FD9D|nr:hemolysin family protein [Yaniella halotolerans]